MKFLGDVFLDTTYKIDIELDDFIFNLEYPLSTSGKPAQNKINLGVDISYIKETFGKFPIAVNLANNHIMDYGEEAFSKTIEYLKIHNIGYFGAGNKKNNFNNPYIVDINDKKMALFGYSCPTTHPVFGSKNTNGSAMIDEQKVIDDIHRVRNKVDYVVIQLHWGDEEIIYPKATDVDKAHMFIDAGADLIIGHHAHVVQSIEKYKNNYIFYGIGNFIFPDFDVPAYYDGAKFQGRANKIQDKANKEMIIVNLDDDLLVSYDTAAFENETIVKKKVNIPKWIPDTQEKYELYKKLWTKKKMLEIFFKNPRIPNIRQIKLLLSIQAEH